MKRITFILLSIVLLLLGCRKTNHILDNNDIKYNDISILRSDFEKQTGYKESNSYSLISSFKTKVDWNKFSKVNDSTFLIHVSLLDTVVFPINDSFINLKSKTVIRAYKTQGTWKYSLIIFVPENTLNGYTGLIINKSLTSQLQVINTYANGKITNNNLVVNKQASIKKLANTGNNNSNCTYVYVNGYLNRVICTSYGGGGNTDPKERGEGYVDPKLFDQMPEMDFAGGGETYHYDCIGVLNGEAYIGDCGKCIGGTTGISSCVEAFNAHIDDNELPECFQDVLSDLKKLSGNSVADIIQKFSNSTSNFNLKFSTLNDESATKTAWVNPIIKDNYVTITFNTNPILLQDVTDLSNATTILHESIHAYLVVWAKNDPALANLSYPELFNKKLSLNKNVDQNSLQHEIFVKDFIKDLAKSVEAFGVNRGYNIPSEYYMDLAWKGLEDTKAFKNLTDQDKTRILDIIIGEQYGIRPQKGTKLKCF